MKIQLPHAPYIANKIALDILNSGQVQILQGLEPIVKVAQELLEEDIRSEMALEERVEEIMDENEDDIEFMQVDRREIFWMIKKRLASEYGFNLSYEDRFSELSHKILEKLWKDGLIEYRVSENMVKNIIFGAIENYLNSYSEVEDIVIEKIENYKRKLIPGSDEYDLVFEKLYQEELRHRGLIP